MKRGIHSFFTLILALVLSAGSMAQTGLVPDQNPNYMISRDKYITIADSVNAFHGITIQDTYKAIDFLQDRRDARDQRREFRQQLRLERVRNGGYGYYNDYNTPYNYNNYPYYNGYRNYRYGRGWNGNYNYYRNALPIAAVTLGTLGWWWCR